MMHWTHTIREVHCGKDWYTDENKETPWPDHCKLHDTSEHCLDIDGDGTHCKFAGWCDVSGDFKYINGHLISIHAFGKNPHKKNKDLKLSEWGVYDETLDQKLALVKVLLENINYDDFEQNDDSFEKFALDMAAFIQGKHKDKNESD